MNKKVGRNDPCPCGSGKKFKKCCERVLLGKKYRAEKIDNTSLTSKVSKVSRNFTSLLHQQKENLSQNSTKSVTSKKKFEKKK